MGAEVPLAYTNPNVGGDAGTWGAELNAILDQLKNAHNQLDVIALKASQLGVQVASLDGSGANAQPPAAHNHNLNIRDSGGTTYAQPTLDIYAGAGNVQQDIPTNVVKLLLAPPDVSAQRIQTQVDNTTTVTTAQSLPDLTKTVPAGYTYEFGALFGIQSTSARAARIGVAFGGSPTYYAAYIHPHLDAANANAGASASAAPNSGADILRWRSSLITPSTNGPQQVGGFQTTASTTYSMWFGVVSNTTGSPADITWSFSPGVAGVAGTTSILPLITRVSYARVTPSV